MFQNIPQRENYLGKIVTSNLLISLEFAHCLYVATFSSCQFGWKNVLLILSWPTSRPEFCVIWLRKMPASGWGSLWESSSFVIRYSTFVYRNVPGTVLECVRICGFKRNSSNLDRAHKMRDSVLLNPWESFLLTLLSVSSVTCVIYSSLILRTDVYRDWPFLRCSPCASLITAANFRLFLNVANFLKGKCYAVMKTEIDFIC